MSPLEETRTSDFIEQIREAVRGFLSYVILEQVFICTDWGIPLDVLDVQLIVKKKPILNVHDEALFNAQDIVNIIDPPYNESHGKLTLTDETDNIFLNFDVCEF
ncbi:hypothetical protein AVEN_161938-1 [Araneus ventricosus]|uniref:Uncharacterized protein n=1 Tax=Araneus ventricosus TaxID=182803 RepID=A0A4Y2P839_ARAVE|nr:hypothetical protein AVEN_161938-1 [Araneus ventricosus]